MTEEKKDEFSKGYERAIELMRRRLKGGTSGVIERRLILTWLDNLEKRKWKTWRGRPKTKS